MMFTDYYGEQSCTAGRSAFILGQSVFRSGLSKVGLPGAELGIKPQDPTIAAMLKAQGYATGQFGKNHLGDRDEHLPTNHGFDEFLGNLYHLNAEEEPENEDYPKDPAFRKRFGPRVVIRSTAGGKIEDTGITENTIVFYSTDNGPHMNTWPDAAPDVKERLKKGGVQAIETPTSGPTSRRTPTTTGCSIAPSFSCRPRPTWPSSWRRSRSFRRARKRAPSTSTR
jgi:arylsulfatase A-like enzyme